MQLLLLATIKGSAINKKQNKTKNHCLDPHLFLKFSAESQRSTFVIQLLKNPSFLYSQHLSTKSSFKKKNHYLLFSTVNINGQNIDRENSKFTSTSQITAIISRGAILQVIVCYL